MYEGLVESLPTSPKNNQTVAAWDSSFEIMFTDTRRRRDFILEAIPVSFLPST